MRIISRPFGCTAALLMAGTAALAAPAAAQASAPPVVPCSSSALVAAIQQGNSAGSAVIRLSQRCDYVLTSAAAPGDGLPPVTGNLTVAGGLGTRISRSSSAVPFRIFEVGMGARLTLVNVTVAGGSGGPNDEGGGILDAGTLVLRNARLTGNASGSGGGLFVRNGAHATVSNSRLDGNSAGAGGAVESKGDLVIDGSTLAGNTATAGGAVFTKDSTTTRISRTVVTRNSASAGGGGLLNQGSMVLTGDRVVLNHAVTGGGGLLNSGTVTLRLTLVALNSPGNCSPATIPGCPH